MLNINSAIIEIDKQNKRCTESPRSVNNAITAAKITIVASHNKNNRFKTKSRLLYVKLVFLKRRNFIILLSDAKILIKAKIIPITNNV